LPREFDEARDRAERLAGRTSLGVGGRAHYLFEPDSERACAELMRTCRAKGLPVRFLGGGYNLLVGDDEIPGVVIATRKLRRFEVFEDRVEVGAGHPFPKLVRQAIELGIPHIPGCPGIPGSIGGVVFMNAGGRFGSVSDALLEVTGVDGDGNRFRRFIHEDDMGYRRSVFGGTLVTGAVFRRDPSLSRDELATRFREAMDWKRATQPLSAQSAGCIFKNPGGTQGPSAGQLIDEAGLKGLRVGGASVSTLHANFIVNEGGATATDVHALIAEIRHRVHAAHGVHLELEVQVWGTPHTG
jgi:UDP-N-acetylmuramate dehydrogenase